MNQISTFTDCLNRASCKPDRTSLRSAISVGGLAAVTLGCLGAVVFLSGCTTDEVGRSKVTTKETINSPTQKSTVTETKTKETTFTPR